MQRFVHFHGQIVPWVSRWTGESDTARIGMARELTTNALKLFYADRGPEDTQDRDGHGVLWTRDGQDRSGRPEFGAVNALRQRRSMLERLCQVCGQPISDDPIPWLLAPKQLSSRDGRYLTMSPPTCSDCVDIARQSCPHLSRHGSRLVHVREYEPWGIYGELAWLDSAGRLQRNTHAVVSLSQPERPLSGVLAKQLVVSFLDFSESS